MKRAVLLCAGLATLSVPAAARAEEARPLSLGEAEQIALGQSPELAMAQKGVDGARARLAATRALRLPRVTLEANVLVWNEELSFVVPTPSMTMPGEFELTPVTVRGQTTASATLSVAQPLTQQIALGKLVDVEEAGVAAAKEDQGGARVEVAYRVADGYLVVLLAEAAKEIAGLRAAQFEAQLARARVLVDGGVLQPVDAMRLEAALAAAQREVIVATSQARQAMGGLVLALGLPPDTVVQVRDDLPDEPKALGMGVDEAVAMASERRPDMRALAHRAEQARSGAGAAKAGLLPELVAVGSYQHNEGGGTFQSADAWFAGLNLQWNVWDWGNTWHGYEEAEAKAAQARMAAERMGDRVHVEVSATALDAQSAYDALAVARTGLAAAEEAFRIQNDRFSEGVATTTDLLDAQTEVTQARLGYASARYAYFRALAALARATGQVPSALLSAL